MELGWPVNLAFEGAISNGSALFRCWEDCVPSDEARYRSSLQRCSPSKSLEIRLKTVGGFTESDGLAYWHRNSDVSGRPGQQAKPTQGADFRTPGVVAMLRLLQHALT